MPGIFFLAVKTSFCAKMMSKRKKFPGMFEATPEVRMSCYQRHQPFAESSQHPPGAVMRWIRCRLTRWRGVSCCVSFPAPQCFVMEVPRHRKTLAAGFAKVRRGRHARAIALGAQPCSVESNSKKTLSDSLKTKQRGRTVWLAV